MKGWSLNLIQVTSLSHHSDRKLGQQLLPAAQNGNTKDRTHQNSQIPTSDGGCSSQTNAIDQEQVYVDVLLQWQPPSSSSVHSLRSFCCPSYFRFRPEAAKMPTCSRVIRIITISYYDIISLQLWHHHQAEEEEAPQILLFRMQITMLLLCSVHLIASIQEPSTAAAGAQNSSVSLGAPAAAACLHRS